MFIVSDWVLPLHTMWAGGYYHFVFSNSQQILLMKEPNKHDARRVSAHHAPLQKDSFGYCTVETFVSITFIATLIINKFGPQYEREYTH